MPMEVILKTLDAEGLRRFQNLQGAAISAVTDRFYATHGSLYQQFGERGRDACREDLVFHLEFLRTVLEFGLVQPMVDYLCWLGDVLSVRMIPGDHLALSLDWLAEFFAGQLAADDAEVVTTALHAARVKYVEASGTALVPQQSPAPWPQAASFEAALLAGKQHEALAIVNDMIDAGGKLVDIELHVIQPALYGIGEKWQANQVTVAQEHLATAIVQSIMTVALLRSQPPVAVNKRIVLACVEGNNHAVGLRMVADAFQMAGWDVQYLGANVPTLALVQQVVEWKPLLLGLSVSFAQQLKGVKAVIIQLEKRLGAARPGVIVGGLAINRFNQLAAAVGADAYSSDAESALDCANRLIGDRVIQ